MGTKIMPVSDLRRKTSEVIAAVRDGGDAVYITQYGRPVVVMVDYEHYEGLVAQVEERTDRTGLETAAAEEPRASPAQRYPTVAAPASSLNAWKDLIPEGCGGDALADTEALYDET
jgi:prevent-host-death family protein